MIIGIFFAWKYVDFLETREKPQEYKEYQPSSKKQSTFKEPAYGKAIFVMVFDLIQILNKTQLMTFTQ